MDVFLQLSLLLFLPSSCVSQCPATFSEVENWCYNFQAYAAGSVALAKDICSSLVHGGKLVDLETRHELVAVVTWITESM